MNASRRQRNALIVMMVVSFATASLVAAEPTAPATVEGKGDLPSETPGGLADKSVPRGTRPGTDGDGLWAWLRLLLALVVVVALIFVARYLLKRFGATGRLSGSSAVLEILARTSLSSRHQLFLVHMGGHVMLVGAGPGGLARLAEITDPDEIAKLLAAVDASKRDLFGSLLKRKARQLETSDDGVDLREGDSEG